MRIQSAAKLRTRHRAACLITSWTVVSLRRQVGRQILPKNLPKWSQNEGFWASWGCLGGILERFGVLGTSWGVLWPSWGRLGTSWERLGSKKVANMVPIWFPKRCQNREKIEAKCDQNLDVFWGRIFAEFGWIWESKMEPSWLLNRSQLRKAIFWKNRVFLQENQWFWRFWSSKLGVKIDQKSIKKWRHDGKASWHRFFMDFDRFGRPSWRQVGIEKRSKIDQKSMGWKILIFRGPGTENIDFSWFLELPRGGVTGALDARLIYWISPQPADPLRLFVQAMWAWGGPWSPGAYFARYALYVLFAIVVHYKLLNVHRKRLWESKAQQSCVPATALRVWSQVER